jgi:hypothetical protein
LAIHFDAASGSPYWLERQADLGIDVAKTVRSVNDLAILGPMDEAALSQRPIEDFVPRSQLKHRHRWIVAETAGTLGRAKFCVHRQDEFHQAFVAPFVAAADRVNFPRGENWLFVGPSGPHIIGKAAAACARALGSPDPFTIDLDPRWAKKLPPGTLGWRRYLDHVETQAMTILQSQRIGVLFSTPIVLESLADRIDEPRRYAVRGLHLGGVAVTAGQRANFAASFPNAVVLAGYGNSLFGMMPEIGFTPEQGICYAPYGDRLSVRIVPLDGGSGEQRLREDILPGERGQVVISRFDETQLILNMMERDSAVRLQAGPHDCGPGFGPCAFADPRPIVNQTLKPAVGFY